MDKMEITETARAKARDFIDNEKQFQLGFLHPDVYGWLCLLPTGGKIG